MHNKNSVKVTKALCVFTSSDSRHKNSSECALLIAGHLPRCIDGRKNKAGEVER